MHIRPFTGVAKELGVSSEKCPAMYRGALPEWTSEINTPWFYFKLHSVDYEDGDKHRGRAKGGKALCISGTSVTL